jgi:integrase
LGQCAVAALTRADLERHLSHCSQGAAHFRLKRVRVLLRFAISRRYRDDDPTIGVVCRPIGREHHTWTDEEVGQYRAHFPLGTRQRLAFELALGTSQRRTDLARLRWEDISGGRIAVTQSKTKARLSLPIHPDLQAALDQVPKGRRRGPVLARSARPAGGALTPESLGTLFAEWCDEAGLPSRCVLHGLRKACCRRLAELGCSEKEIAAISGHRTLGEIARYTRAASQERLANSAHSKIVGATPDATQGADPAIGRDVQ